MITINQIKCPIGETITKEILAKKIQCNPSDIHSFQIVKESLDARKNEMHFLYTVNAEIKNESKFLKQKDVKKAVLEKYESIPATNFDHRPLIVGFGPSGMFAGLLLAEAGLKPIIFEQGQEVDKRIQDVDAFTQKGILNTKSNVQFGEGGAGTFSDGKLTTRVKDIRVSKVLEEFIEAGADPAISYQAHPHLGTDHLRPIVKNIREKILQLGGTVYFNTTVEKLILTNQKVTGIIANGKEYMSETVLLCLGHSAIKTFETLYDQKLFMEPKDFAMGVRIEHPQILINKNQYGSFYNHPALGSAEYRLTHTAKNGRGVYTFCMCPGGLVMPSSSDENTIVVNGMSNSARDAENANSALLVQVKKEDFYHSHPLDGFAFQKQHEEKAFQYAKNYQAPAQNAKDYVEGKVSTQFSTTPSYSLGVVAADLNTLFPDYINEALKDALPAFDRKIPGFMEKGVMTGIESRSSCPLRITRNANCQSVNTEGVFPCGEGAGYAGGIVSSAMDGIRCAEQVILYLNARK